MAVRIVNNLCDSLVGRTVLAGNSQSFAPGAFVQLSGGYLVTAGTSGKIEGVANATLVTAADNTTVGLVSSVYTPAHPGTQYEVTITGGTITQADEGKYYNLATATTVDGTTEATAESSVTVSGNGETVAVSTMQLRLVEYVSSTLGRFEIV